LAPNFQATSCEEEFKFVLGGIHSQNADIAQQDDRLELRKLAPHNSGKAALKKTNADSKEIDKIGNRPRSPAICGLPNMS
jgi:hypothetical protein